MTPAESPRTIIRTYIATQALFTLSTSIIWGVNTLFLLGAGLTIFQVFVANAAFSAGDLLFQVPTGVIADTLGRKTSFLLSLATLVVSTLGYLAAARYHLGLGVFALASVFLGLGFTFYTGAVDAWLVDALDRVGYTGTRQQVFAWGGMAFSGATLVGTLAGGLLGQVNLSLPYVVRTVMLVLTFILAAVFMRETGEARPKLTLQAFGRKAREVASTGVQYGMRHPVVRPLLIASAVSGLFFIYGVYSWQRYFLDLLGIEAVWVNGVIAASFSLSGIVGNALVSRVTHRGERPAAPLLAWIVVAQSVLIVAIGAIGVLLPQVHGLVPFGAAVALWLAFGTLFGIFRPVRQAFINPHIRSSERATVLSVDQLMADGGGVVGQLGLGYISQAISIPFAWVISGVAFSLGYPLYRKAGEADAAEGPPTVTKAAATPPR
jgi:MFS family permease